jgi:hypothetical protein
VNWIKVAWDRGPVVGSHEHSNQSLGSIQDSEYGGLNYFKLVKDTVPKDYKMELSGQQALAA